MVASSFTVTLNFLLAGPAPRRNVVPPPPPPSARGQGSLTTQSSRPKTGKPPTSSSSSTENARGPSRKSSSSAATPRLSMSGFPTGTAEISKPRSSRQSISELPSSPPGSDVNTRGLKSVTSNASLRSVNDEMHIPKKRKRLFPFQTPSRRDTSPNTSRPSSRTDHDRYGHAAEPFSPPPPNLTPAAAKRLGIPFTQEENVGEESEASTSRSLTPTAARALTQGTSDKAAESKNEYEMHGLENAMAQLPANLKPAAAKRLGVQLTIPVTARSSSVPTPVLRSRAGSPQRSTPREPIAADIPTRPVLISRSSASELRAGALIPPINGAPRPEHPLEIQARTTSQSGAPNTSPKTFFSASSDSDEDDSYSSHRSYASSRTSYGVGTFSDPDMSGMVDGAGDRFYPSIFGRRKDGANNRGSSSTNHHSQGSTSSIGSVRGTHASPSRPLSFSRPFSKGSQTIDQPASSEHSMPPINESVIRVDTSQAPHYLTAINEDTTAPVEDVSRPTTSSAQKPFSHRRDFSGSRNFSRPRAQEKTSQPTSAGPGHAKVASIGGSRSAKPSSPAVTISRSVISAAGAEKVILRIFEALDNFDDLAACARLNKGFYHVYKRHELRLLKNALRNFSPAQWELRESTPKEIIAAIGRGNTEYTPLRYIQFHRRDTFILTSLKVMMLQRCQAHLRPETIAALSERDPAKSARVDDAFWRVSTFCTLFGSNSSREKDLNAQVDWLRGGVVAHRPTTPNAGSSKSKSSRVDASSTSFGRGNYGGLSFEELDDLTEIWNALKILLRGITRRGRVAQARAHGVFDAHNIASGDMHAEQILLGEWVDWLAMQGLQTISDLATYSELSSPVVFATARAMDWTDWKAPPRGESRSGFLRLAIAQTREEKNAHKAFTKFSEVEEAVSERRKSRGAELAAKLREQERGFELTDNSSFEDKGLGLWVRWMRQVESDEAAAKAVESDKKTSAQTSSPPIQRPQHALRQRSSSNSLSLFPPQYTQKTTPAAPAKSPASSSPTAKHPRSILKRSQSAERLQNMAQQAHGDAHQKLSAFPSRLSVCPET